MRIILLAICLLHSTFLLSQNLQDYPAPLPDHGQQHMADSEAILNDPLRTLNSNQRIAQVGQFAANEGDRLIFDSLIWEVYNEEKDAWEFSSMYWYERDERRNPLLYVYRLFDSENQKWINETKREKTFNEDDFETSFIEYSWNKESEAWIPVKRWTRAYDNKKVTLYEWYDWNEEHESWEGTSREEYVFDESGFLVENSGAYSWDWNTDTWIGDYKYEYTINERGLTTQQIRYSWDTGSSSWKELYKQEATFDELDLETIKIGYDWVTENGEWEESWKDERSYNINNEVEQIIHYYWTGSEFLPNQKWEYIRDEDNPISQTNEYLWKSDAWEQEGKSLSNKYTDNGIEKRSDYSYKRSVDGSAWVLISNDTSSWSSEGLLYREYYHRNFVTNEISSAYKNVRAYNSFGEYTIYENYEWDVDRKDWYGVKATHTLIDENNYILDKEQYKWDFESSSWIGYNRYAYEVNDHAKRKSSKYYNWIDGGWKHTYRSNYYFHLDCSSSSTPVANYLTLADQTELCSVESLEAPTAIGCGGHLTATTDAEFPIETVGTHEVIWTYDDGNGNTSTQTQKVIIDQSCQPLSVEDLSSLIEVYPNPSLGQINFKKQIDDLKIYNQKGQLEMHIKSPGASINVSGLKAGVYYLSLGHQSKTSRVKIVKN